MKTEKEIKDRATEEAMCHVFSDFGDLDRIGRPGFEYEYLTQCAANPSKSLYPLIPWEAFESRNAEQLLNIVNKLVECFEEAMTWAQK